MTAPICSRPATAVSSSPLRYQDDFTLIGTTDADFDGAPDEVGATSEEIAYLCRAANGFFRRPIAPARRGLVVFGPASAAG